MPGVNETFRSYREGEVLGAGFVNQMSAAITRLQKRRSSGGKKHVVMLGTGVEEIEIDDDGLDFYLTGEETLPSYGIAIITNSFTIDDDIIPSCAKPTSYGCQENFVINDIEPCDGTSRGVGQLGADGFYKILYDETDGAPVFGDAWGPRSGTWKAKKDTGGFFVIGVCDADNHILLAKSRPMDSFYGKNSGAAIGAGGTGTINIFTGLWGAETDSGVTMPAVLARFGTIAAGAMVECFLSKTTSSSTAKWYAIQTDKCPS